MIPLAVLFGYNLDHTVLRQPWQPATNAMNIAEKQWKEGCCVPACQECATDLRGFWRLCGNRRIKHYHETADIVAFD
jgi:hypothetical protein